MAGAETANYACPKCNGQLVRDNTTAKRFRCRSCGGKVHEAVAEMADDLELLAGRDDTIGDLAAALLEPEQ